jgi:hypothetical protein
MTTLLSPKELEKLTHEEELAKANKALEAMKRKEDEERELREAFMSREIHPQVKERVNAAVSRAARAGEKELMVVSFPASFCNDAGRRINNAEPDWPASLEGFAKVAYDYFERELKPLGFKVQARVLDYPGGMLGKVGLFLMW